MTRRTDDYAAGFADAIEKAAGVAYRQQVMWKDEDGPRSDEAHFIGNTIRALTPDPPPECPGRQVTEEMVEAGCEVVALWQARTTQNVQKHDGAMVREILEAALAVSHDQKGGL